MEKSIPIPNFHRTISNESAILELLEQINCEESLKEILGNLFCFLKENNTYKAIQQYDRILVHLEDSTSSQELKNIMFDWKATPDGKGGYNVSPSNPSYGGSDCCCWKCCDSCDDCFNCIETLFLLIGGIIGIMVFLVIIKELFF